ncbi:hypothetical protein IAR55_004174 [Kwoniella newhampshirensis]|uniref:Uncharacterized protein n=1 Tax=Kwoniella newhampshirensis TaxID=1651941 RepID=A0AAW0YLR1_9TREE
MSTSPLPPLFTTSPLCRTSQPAVPSTPSAFTFASPLSTHGSHTPSPPTKSRGSPSFSASPNLSSTYFETLSFAKVPVGVPPLTTATSTTVSTDSEAGCISSSDWAVDHGPRSGAQSPSLITCLFQSQSQPSRSRQTSSNCSSATSPNPTLSTPTCKTVSKPILRRGTTASTSASEDCREQVFSAGFGLGISKASDLVPSTRIGGDGRPIDSSSNGPIKKRPSVLTFAVNPCLPSPRAGPSSRSRSRSTSVSPMSSYRRSSGRSSPPPLRMPTWGATHTEEGEEVEDEDEEEFVESPLPIPGHESDSDEGYHEDEEDGYTSEEEMADAVDTTFTPGVNLKHRPSWTSKTWDISAFPNVPPAPQRRSRTVDAYPTSTDDYEQLYATGPGNGDGNASIAPGPYPYRGRKTSISIVAAAKPSSSRCTRHRSPPPPIRLSVERAPPAARSPSAAELCRRRGSLADSTPDVCNGGQGSRYRQQGKGWKSDDSAFFHSFASASAFGPGRRPSAPACDTTFHLPSASRNRNAPPRKASLPTPSLSSGKGHCRSILRSHSTASGATSIPMQRSSGGATAKSTTRPPTPTKIQVVRGGSVPSISVDTRVGEARSGVSRNGSSSAFAKSASEQGESAREGLKRVLKTGGALQSWEVRVM